MSQGFVSLVPSSGGCCPWEAQCHHLSHCMASMLGVRSSGAGGGDGDLLPTATVQGQIGSASDQPGLVQSVAVHGTGVERDIL